MFSFTATISLFVLILIAHSNEYFPVSTQMETCCADPVHAFIVREFSGDCACQTLQQKWRRYVDWVEMEGGYIHPFIEMNYVGRYQDIRHPIWPPTKQPRFKIHSHERGMFVNIRQKYIRTIDPKALLMQIPFSISFSQFLISKYIKNASHPLIPNPHIKQILFSKPNHFMPDGFPDWDVFRANTKRIYHVDSIRGWLALGLAWLRHNTHELLPWLELLPSPYYLPFTWVAWVRDELLTGTRALPIVRQLEREFHTALPYVDMLGLKEAEVKEAFAFISSRSFGMSFESIGGAKKSPVIPCGIDFFNHNVFVESSIYYDPSFGENRFECQGPKPSQSSEIVEKLVSHKGSGSIREIDFASNYLWINSEYMNASQIYVNYGKQHTSASRVALFGFMDEVHPYDHYPVPLTIHKNDTHSELKRHYFKTVWNASYTKRHSFNIDTRTCHVVQEISTWHALGQKPKYYQNNKRPSAEQRVLTPPLTMEYYGQNVISVAGNFLRFLRLLYLPTQYFDSFTISAILNDFEYDYLHTVMDPIVQKSLNRVCDHLLNRYPTTYTSDQEQLQQIERERKRIMNLLRWNRNRNMTKTNKASYDLSRLDRSSLALQYRLREKSFLKTCSNLHLEPTSQYLKSVMQKKQKKRKKKIVSMSDLQELLNVAFDWSHLLSDNDTHSRIVNQSNGSINLDSSALEQETLDLLESVDIDVSLLDNERSQEIWADLIRQAAMQTTQSILGNTYNNHRAEDADKEEEETATRPIVSIEELMIGEPKKAKQTLAETVGWNSPNAGLRGSNTQQPLQNIVFTNSNGQQLDLSTLFGGGATTFTIRGGGLQINNGQLMMGDNTQLQLVGNTNNINQAIPQIVPFSQVMGHATTYTVVSVNGNEQSSNVAQLLNRMKDKAKAKP